MDSQEEKTTTIRVAYPTKGRLDKLGTKKDSYDTVVKRLLDFWDKYKDVIDARL